jgi:hypothetical protein
MPDKNGVLVKKDSAFVKKNFAKLSASAQNALAEYVIGVQNRQPTDAARKTVYNSIIDAAVAAYKEGKKQTPWDVLEVQLANTPPILNKSIAYTNYDKFSTDALLRKMAKDLGFPPAAITDADLSDFFSKVTESTKAGAKQTQVIIGPDGTQETITTPAQFDINTFAQNYLWSKVNLGDAKSLPTSVINQANALRNILKDNGLQLSDKEVTKYSYDIAKGDKTIADLQRDFSEMAAKLYPLYADRLRATPGLTVREAASSILNPIAAAWEIDPNELDITDPNIDQFIRPDGVIGKAQPKSAAEVSMWAMNHPNREKTKAEISRAQDAAVQFARVMGFGV